MHSELLNTRGFFVAVGAVAEDRVSPLADAYDRAVADAAPADVREGSSTTRVTDFVNRGAEFDGLWVFPPLLDACRQIIGPKFKLSSLHARTLRPKAGAGEWHVDVARNSADWPIVSFIVMIDEFGKDNGATRFIPGSHHSPQMPADVMTDDKAEHPDEVLACGAAGSMLIFHGSVWHGYSANRSLAPRRSIQGAMIPMAGSRTTDFDVRMTPETRARLGPEARRLIGV